MKRFLSVAIVCVGCNIFFEIHPDTLCEIHCWNVKHCEQAREPLFKVVDQPPVHVCANVCREQMTTLAEQRMRESHSAGEACDYVEFYASRFGETVDCDGDAMVVGLEIFDCYAR